MSRTTSSSSIRRRVRSRRAGTASAGGLEAGRLGAGREQDAEDRAPARRALDAQGAPVTAHDTEDRGEAEAAPGELRREERLEDPVHGLRVHPRPVVAHLEEHVAARREWLPARPPQRLVGRGHVPRPRGHGDGPAPLADRLGAVDDQVHQHLLDLAHVGVDERQARVQPRLEPHALRHRHLEQRQVLAHEGVHVGGPHHEVPAPRVGQHLPGEVGGPLHRARRLLHVPAGRASLRELLQGQRGVAEDRGEEVVEVVGHAAGENAEALLLRRPPQRLLRRLPLRDVDRHAEHRGAAGAGERERDLRGLQVPHPAPACR